MSTSFFMRFFISSLASSAVISVIILAKKALRKHISVRWQYNMDLLFLILLAAPFIPGGLFGSVNAGCWFNAINIGRNFPAAANAAAGEITEAINGMGWTQDFSISADRAAPGYLPLFFMGIWITGVIFFALLSIISNKNLRLIKESAKPVEDAETLSLFARCKTELGIAKDIPLSVSVLVKAPMTLGVFKTRIILPAGNACGNNTRCALLHELTHCKNRDIAINAVMCLFQILYWFNPLVYFIFKEIRLDREMACDASVLKRLPEELHIAYGRTLLSFVNVLPRSAALSFSAELGGSKPQIVKRVKHIASFTAESWPTKAKSVCVFIISGMLILGQIPAISAFATVDDGKYTFHAENIVYEDLSQFFDGFDGSFSGNFDGSFVLYDMENDSYTIHNKEKSLTRVPPASTCKIYSGLIALETGVIEAGNSTRKWNGTTYPFDSWNRDQDLISAMQNSVSWYFQMIDTQAGINELNYYFKELAYGNRDLSAGAANYWMESLRISPVEQVELLKRVYINETPFQDEHVNTMKDILRLSEKDGAVLSGKTGTISVDGKVTNGWFIGYVENGGQTFIFAANIQGVDNAGGSAAAQIVTAILSDKGIY